MDTMINAIGFKKKEFDDGVTGKSIIPAEISITVKDKEIAEGLRELFRLGVAKTVSMKKTEAYARGYNELSKSIKEAWGEEIESDPIKEYLEKQHLEAEHEYGTAHKAIKRSMESYNEYERCEEEL